jgi:hypothetical protein
VKEKIAPSVKICLMIFVLLGFPQHYQADAAFFIKRKATVADTAYAAQPIEMVRRHSVLHTNMPFVKRFRHKFGEMGHKSGNSRGIASLLCIGAFLAFFTAVVIITPTIPNALAIILLIAAPVASVAAIILGIRGVRYDRKIGFALTGLVLGIGVLFLETLMELFILAVTGTFPFI